MDTDKPQMNTDIKVSASILCADFTKLGEEIRKCEDAGVDMLHIDVMDGHFVPNITIGPLIIKAIRPLTKLVIEAHLMIENPDLYVKSFADAGADIIAVHAECFGQLKVESQGLGKFPKELALLNVEAVQEGISKIHECGKKAYLVFNPGSPLSVEPLLNELDGVLIMSVNPGFANQKFMPSALPKIAKLRAQFAGDIAVDGGINELTAPEVVKAGANVLVTASYFFGADKPHDVTRFLKGLSPSGRQGKRD